MIKPTSLQVVRVAVLCAASVGAICSNGAAAQNAEDQKPAADSSANQGNLIVVTARRQEETITDVPIAITAFNSESLEKRRIEDLSDAALLTPGLSFETQNGGSFGTPVIRGVTQQSTTVLEQNVSVFLDGVYLPRTYAFDLGTQDLQRLEIVKGPQGALYGQNSFMGAINYVTKMPTNEFGADLEATIGSDERYEVAGAVNVPIAPDIFNVRVNGAYSTFDGTWPNNHPLADADIAGPSTNGNLGGWERWNLGVKALLTPTDTITIDATYRHFDISNEGSARVNFTGADFLSSPDSVTDTRNNCGVLDPFGFGLFCGELPEVDPDRVALDPRQYGVQAETDFVAVNVEFEPTDRLTLKYGFGWLQTDVIQVQSQADRNSLVEGATMNFTAVPLGGQEYWQHEVRARFDVTENIELSAGGFWAKNEDEFTFLIGPGIPTLSTEPVELESLFIKAEDSITDVDTKAVFGALRFAFLDDRAHLSLEGRYTWEDKDVLSVTADVLRGVSSNYFNPRMTFDFDVTEETSIYASAAKGTKAGGVNPDPAIYAPFGGLVPEERTFGPDENWTYELGVKSGLLDNRLLLELAAFYVDVSSYQINTLSTEPEGFILPPGIDRAPTIILNLGGATVKGFELQGSFQATEELSLFFGGSYQDASYKNEVIGTRTLDICDGIVCGEEIGGNKLQRSPSTTAFGGFIYEAPLSERMDLRLQADVAYQDKQFVDETNTSTVEDRTLVNASAALDFGDFSAQLWVKNAFNLNYNSFSVFGPFRTSFYTPIPGPRRTFGLTLRADLN